MKKGKMDYASAGVDIAAADEALKKIKTLAKNTFNKSVLSEIGSFGGFFKPDLAGYKNPVLISSTDSVGTKLKLAFLSNRHHTVGEDLVNHCVNDILVHGAKPLFFLDYIGIGKLNPETVVEIVEGLSRACKKCGAALIGGEMAELPDFYHPGEYDLVGCIVGIVEEDKIIDGSTIKERDIVIGLPSSGLHTNGYTLARKIVFENAGLKYDDFVEELNMTIGDALLMIHKSYLDVISAVLEGYEVHGTAHITGGGIEGNFIRILPQGLRAVIDRKSWKVPPIFTFLQKMGDVSQDDMFEAFNMGIGYVMVAPEKISSKIYEFLESFGETPYIIGKIDKGEKAVLIE